jgi:hypothetical protein
MMPMARNRAKVSGMAKVPVSERFFTGWLPSVKAHLRCKGGVVATLQHWGSPA